MTLLQHLAAASRLAQAADDEKTASGEPAVNQNVVPQTSNSRLPNMILAIEEPELYQHPSKQRHLSRILAALAAGTVPGVAASTQVLYATHSPLFVSMDRCDELRLVRRTRCSDGSRNATVKGVDLGVVAKAIEGAWMKPNGSFSADGLRTKLHVLTPVVCEAFFAGTAILTEGEGDIAALKATAALQEGIDFEAINCALVPCGGKGNIDKVLAILRLLEIPTYVIWDLDKNAKDKCPEANAALFRMHGIDPAEDPIPRTKVKADFTCHADKLETTMAADFGDAYPRLLDEIVAEFGVRQKEAVKSPFVMSEIVTRAAAEGLRSPTLEGLVHAIWRKCMPPTPSQEIAVGSSDAPAREAPRVAAAR